MIYTVTLNPALDKTVEIPGMALDTVNRITEMRTDPGGKGINVSKVIAKLGGDSRAVGILGGESGRTLEKLLENENFTTQFRFVEGQTRTNIKILDRVGHTNTDINEPGLTFWLRCTQATSWCWRAVCRRAHRRTPTACGRAHAKKQVRGCSSMRTALYWQKA